eukprot:scaffold16987_cov60-Phaeocystis_antarctica.AAC.2
MGYFYLIPNSIISRLYFNTRLYIAVCCVVVASARTVSPTPEAPHVEGERGGPKGAHAEDGGVAREARRVRRGAPRAAPPPHRGAQCGTLQRGGHEEDDGEAGEATEREDEGRVAHECREHEGRHCAQRGRDLAQPCLGNTARPREYLHQVGGKDRVEEGEGGARCEQGQHHHPTRDERRPQRHRRAGRRAAAEVVEVERDERRSVVAEQQRRRDPEQQVEAEAGADGCAHRRARACGLRRSAHERRHALLQDEREEEGGERRTEGAWVSNAAKSTTWAGPHGHTTACRWVLSGSAARPTCVVQPGAWSVCPRRPG